jgi:hypothetical protein
MSGTITEAEHKKYQMILWPYFALKGLAATKELANCWIATLAKYPIDDVVDALSVAMLKPGIDIKHVIEELRPSCERIAEDRWKEFYEDLRQGRNINGLTEDTIATVKRCGGTGFVASAENVGKAKEKFVTEYIELHQDRDKEAEIYRGIIAGALL